MSRQLKHYSENADKINDARKSLYRERVDAGLCPKCGKGKAPDSRLCQEHRDGYKKFQTELAIARRIVRGMGNKAQHQAFEQAKEAKSEAI